MATDVRLTEGLPTLTDEDEVILCYPGLELEAVTVYRLAHELHRLRSRRPIFVCVPAPGDKSSRTPTAAWPTENPPNTWIGGHGSERQNRCHFRRMRLTAAANRSISPVVL